MTIPISGKYYYLMGSPIHLPYINNYDIPFASIDGSSTSETANLAKNPTLRVQPDKSQILDLLVPTESWYLSNL